MKPITAFIIVLALVSCQKEEFQYTGDVEFIFHIEDNMGYSDISNVNIYASDIVDVPLFKDINVKNGVLLLTDLNEGNYIIEYNYIYKTAFQISIGKKETVDLYYEDE